MVRKPEKVQPAKRNNVVKPEGHEQLPDQANKTRQLRRTRSESDMDKVTNSNQKCLNVAQDVNIPNSKILYSKPIKSCLKDLKKCSQRKPNKSVVLKVTGPRELEEPSVSQTPLLPNRDTKSSATTKSPLKKRIKDYSPVDPLSQSLPRCRRYLSLTPARESHGRKRWEPLTPLPRLKGRVMFSPFNFCFQIIHFYIWYL